MIDFSDYNQIRDRYVGIELYQRANVIRLDDISGAIELPGDLITFSELGAPWIDRSILSTFRRARIFSLLAANAENSEFMREVDRFKSITGLIPQVGYQVVLYHASEFENCYRTYSNTLKILEGAPDWVNQDHQTILIDQGFLYLTAQIFNCFLIDRDENAVSSFERCVSMLLEHNTSALQGLQSTGLERYLSGICIGNGRRLDDEIKALFQLDPIEKDVIKRFKTLYSEIDLDLAGISLKDKRFRDQSHLNEMLANWVRSVQFHFIIGHELGHICYAQKERLSKHLQILSIVQAELSSEQMNYEEECFCDFIALQNVIFQAKEFDIPVVLAALAVEIAWSAASFPFSNKHLTEARRRVMTISWRYFGFVKNWFEFEKSYSTIIDIVPAASSVIIKRLPLIKKINRGLNPSDAPFVRSLNTKLRVEVILNEDTKTAEIHLYAF